MFNMGQNTARSKRLNVSTLSLAVYTGWFVALCSESCTAQTVYDIEESGAVADVDTIEQMQSNAEIIQTILDEMEDGDTLYVPNKTFHTVGGLSRSVSVISCVFLICHFCFVLFYVFMLVVCC
jgi:hypothetical protein